MTNRATHERAGDEASPRVCWCMRVHEATLVRAIRAGHDDLDAVARATRAGTGCGTCRSELLDLLAREQARAGTRSGSDAANEGPSP
jgi:NAD(P)H-nitrite reductase large subunit